MSLESKSTASSVLPLPRGDDSQCRVLSVAMLLTRNTGTKFPALKEQEICDLGYLGSLIVTTGLGSKEENITMLFFVHYLLESSS